MELIDVTRWKNDIFSDYGGYTRKIGKIDENGNRWMVKFEKKHTFKSSPLNLFEQHINSEILSIIGFPVQETFLGICNDYLVLCCKNLVPTGSKLVTYETLLRRLYNSYELVEIPDLVKLEHVWNTLDILQPYKEHLVQSFWDMVFWDLFIGNLERTISDFGCIVSKNGIVIPAPLYDNRTTGLACTISLQNNGKPILRDDILHSHSYKDFEDARRRILPILECKMSQIHNLVYEQECLSEAQKSWKFEQLQRALHDLKSDL